MSSLISLFVFENKNVRFGGTPEKPLVVAADLCQMLDVRNVSQAIDRLDQDEKETISITYTDLAGIIRTTQALAVNESGMFSLILSSRKAVAKRLKKWVTSEVLPSIRRTGSYSQPTQAQPDGLGLKESCLICWKTWKRGLIILSENTEPTRR